VSSTEPWRVDRSLFIAGRRRCERDEPTSAQIAAVHDWLLDAMLDPLHAGAPDPDVEGLWLGRPGRGALVIYGLDLNARSVAVFEIATAG
jgi:hypothetical protein